MVTATNQFDDDTPLATDLQQFAYLAIIWLSFLRQRSMRSSPTARRRRHRWSRHRLSCDPKSSAVRTLTAPDQAH